MRVTTITASANMFAVIMYPTCCGPAAPEVTSHQYIGKIQTTNSNGTADYGVQGSREDGRAGGIAMCVCVYVRQ